MPIMYIFHSPKLTDELVPLNHALVQIISEHLNVKEKIVELLYVPANHIHYGKDIYIEIRCRIKPERTPELLEKFMQRLHVFFSEIGHSRIKIVLCLYEPENLMVLSQ